MVATACVIAGVSVVAGHQDRSNGPALPGPRTPTVTTKMPRATTGPTPQQIVDDPNARLIELAVSNSAGGVTAAAWQLCASASCRPDRFAIAVSDDGFVTSKYVALPNGQYPSLTTAGADSFYVGEDRGWGEVLRSDGSVSPVEATGLRGPLAPDEVLISHFARSTSYLGLNPRTALAHPLSTPAADDLQLLQGQDGRVWGTASRTVADPTHTSVVWSTDGGATWSEHALGNSTLLYQPIVSAVPGVMAVVEGGDGATVFPFDKVYRTKDGGATWEVAEESTGDTAYLGWAAVRSNGELLVAIGYWSDDRVGHPGKHAEGLYQSNGDNWSDLSLVVPGMPASANTGNQFVWDVSLLSADVDDQGRLTLYVSDANSKAYVSADGGSTWAPVAAR